MTMPLDDRGLLLGDGVFETILAIDGELILFDAHIARLRRACWTMGLNQPEPDAARRLCELALGDTGATSGRFALRLTLTAGSGGRGLNRPEVIEPHVFATTSRHVRPEGAIGLRTSAIRRNPTSPGARMKTLSYLDNVMARREAEPAEALMLNTGGDLACAAAANLFWIKEGRLFTPSLDCGVLDGVMRRQVLLVAGEFGLSPREGSFPPSALTEAEAVFLTSSLIGVRPVSSLDGLDLPTLPVVRDLADRLSEVS